MLAALASSAALSQLRIGTSAAIFLKSKDVVQASFGVVNSRR